MTIHNIYDTHLVGTHDLGAEGLHGNHPGWVVSTEETGLSLNQSGRNYSAQAEQGFTVIARLNVGYGNEHGSIPYPHEYQQWAEALGALVYRSKGCRIWVIGNEPNHENERKGGVVVTPQQYAQCFALCRQAIKRADQNALVLHAGIAPYHASPMPWDEWLRQSSSAVAGLGGWDGLALHAYTRGWNAADIASTAKMGDDPLQHTYSGFLTYRDQLACIPAGMHTALSVITEYDPQDLGWPGDNRGLMVAATNEIQSWNLAQGDAGRVVHGVVAYRLLYDHWRYDNKPGTQDDIRQAANKGFRAPNRPTIAGQQTGLPSVPGNPTPQPPTPQPPAGNPYLKEWDPRLDQRGTVLTVAQTSPGVGAHHVTVGKWFDEQEAQGRVNVFVRVLNMQGELMKNVPVTWFWGNGGPGESDTKPTEIKSDPFLAAVYPQSGGKYSLDFNMSEVAPSYGLKINEITQSDKLWGMGLGDIANPHHKIHTCYLFEFQYLEAPAVPVQPPTQPQPPITPPSGGVPPLLHPVRDPRHRTITQPYGRGVNQAYYSRFTVDGVPLEGHNGVDYATPIGDVIQAASPGVVVESANDTTGYGLYLKLVHSWGETLYAHLQSASVAVGDTVIQGQLLGYSGNSGKTTGPHLHFGMRENPYNRADGMGGYSDPLPYIGGMVIPPITPPTQPPPSGEWTPAQIQGAIHTAAGAYGFAWQLIAAQAWAESSYRPDAVSPAGAMGLMQIMQPTWDEWAANVNQDPVNGGVSDPFDPYDNAMVGAAYLDWLYGVCDNNIRDALIAYGYGIGNFLNAQDKGEPMPAMWQNYADKIIYGNDLLKATYPND